MPGPKRTTDPRTERDEMFSEIFPRINDAAFFMDHIACSLEQDGNPPETCAAWFKLGEELRSIAERAMKLAK